MSYVEMASQVLLELYSAPKRVAKPASPEAHTADLTALPEPTQEEIDRAGVVLAKAGVRLIGGVHGVDYVGVWSDLDGPEVRAAISVLHPHGMTVHYLDGDGIPMKYKLRKVPGEPVPANVLAAMERAG